MELKGKEIINKIVSLWTNKYLYLTTFINKNDETYNYICEFSRPLPGKPNPEFTVKVYFFIEFNKEPVQYEDQQNNVNQQINELCKDIQIRFRFENDSLYHNPRSTIVNNLLENWIERYLAQKKRTSQVIFLGTDFDKTRIVDPRMDQILKQINYLEKKVEVKYLSEDLLQFKEELEQLEMLGDEQLQLRYMRKVFFDTFRAYDKLDSGVITFKEYEQVLKLLNIHLDDVKLSELFYKIDKNNNGLIEYPEWVETAGQIIFGIFVQNLLKKMLKIKEEEFLILAIMILIDDPIHENINQLINNYRLQDKENEIETETVKILDLQQELTNEKYQFDELQVDELVKIFRKNFKEEVPYNQVYEYINHFKINNLKNGMMESSYTKIELYLISIFEPYQDKKKKCYIHIDHMQQALRMSNQIRLTDIQLYILQSIVNTDEDHLLNYKVECRMIGEMIKRYFAPQFINKLNNFLQKANVSKNEYMEGWSEKDIKNDIDELQINYKTNEEIFGLNEINTFLQQKSFNLKQDNSYEKVDVHTKVLSELILGNSQLYEQFDSFENSEVIYNEYVNFKTKKGILEFNNI